MSAHAHQCEIAELGRIDVVECDRQTGYSFKVWKYIRLGPFDVIAEHEQPARRNMPVHVCDSVPVIIDQLHGAFAILFARYFLVTAHVKEDGMFRFCDLPRKPIGIYPRVIFKREVFKYLVAPIVEILFALEVAVEGERAVPTVRKGTKLERTPVATIVAEPAVLSLTQRRRDTEFAKKMHQAQISADRFYHLGNNRRPAPIPRRCATPPPAPPHR